MKKMMALALAVVMCMSMSVIAFAAGDYSITIENKNTASSINGKEYKAYKVFDLTLGGESTDADTGEKSYSAYAYSIKTTDWAYSYLTADATTDATTKKITTKYGITLIPSASDATQYTVDGATMTEANARALADALATHLPTTAAGSATGASEKATITLDEPGYYAVYGVVVPNDPKNDPAEEVVAALALTTTDPKATVEPKAEVPTLDKKITGEHVLDDAGKAATAEVGKTVSFQLDSKVPDLTGYTDYTFTITDTMTDGLTFTTPEGKTNDAVVKIKGVDKTSEATIAVEGQKLTITIPYNTLKAATKGDAIVVTYSAVVNDKALTTDYEKNTAKLTYSNNPTDTSSKTDTPDKEVYVIDVDINVNKVANSSEGAKLKDAEFLVFKGSTTPGDSELKWYKWDTTKKEVTWVAKADADTFKTGDGGKFTPAVQGLEAEKDGTSYGLLETKAPTGYNLLADPVIVTLKAAYSEAEGAKTATVTATGAAVTDGTVTLSAEQNSKQPLATATVVNNTGTELPSTGGIGTTLFYVIGAILVLGAGILLVTRRRMSADR